MISVSQEEITNNKCRARMDYSPASEKLLREYIQDLIMIKHIKWINWRNCVYMAMKVR